jgi:hypothetical protein
VCTHETGPTFVRLPRDKHDPRQDVRDDGGVILLHRATQNRHGQEKNNKTKDVGGEHHAAERLPAPFTPPSPRPTYANTAQMQHTTRAYAASMVAADGSVQLNTSHPAAGG